MQRVFMALLAGIATIGLASVSHAASTAATATYKLAQQDANTTHRRSQEQCMALTDISKNVCLAEADAIRVRTKAIAKVQYKGTWRAHANARIAIANADYKLAEARCDSQTGNEKEACLKAAKAVNVATKANSKANKAARNAVVDNKLDTNTKLALEKRDIGRSGD